MGEGLKRAFAAAKATRERLFVSRICPTKLEANRVSREMEKHGAKSPEIYGKRGGPYRVRARMYLSDFAKFCAAEARMRQGK